MPYPLGYGGLLWSSDLISNLLVTALIGIEEHGIEARRRGLENFLNRVASHPVLGSTKLLRDFLTEKDDKDWKIGRQISNIKVPKAARKLFTAPVYCTVKYPPFNVPINQWVKKLSESIMKLIFCTYRLPSIEKFSRFSRVLEIQIQALQNTCQQLCQSSGKTMSIVNMLGKDFQKMAKGAQPVSAGECSVTYDGP